MINFIRKSFKRKLLSGFLLTSVLPLVLTSCLLIQLFKVKVESDHEKINMEQAALIQSTLETKFQEFSEVTEKIAKNEEIKELLIKSEPSVQKQVYSLLYEATSKLRTVAEFSIYTGGGVCISSTSVGLVHENLPTYWGILRMATAHAEQMIIRQERDYAGNTDILLQAARVICDSEDNKIGYVVVSLSEEEFEKILNGMYSSQDGVCILNEFWEEVYCAGMTEKMELAEVLRQQLMDGEEISDSYKNNSVYISEVGDTGLYSVYLRPKALEENTLQTMYQVVALLTLVAMVFSVLVSVKLTNSFNKPVKRLNEAMREVQEGKLDTQIKVDRVDEFGQLAQSFNTMTVELKGYVERQVRHQKELNESNIAMMHAQLNPHFLYNTLDTMKWVAKANGIQELAVMATKLAKILRTSISKDQFITLREEMDLVESYVRIQEIRFSDKFSYEVSIQEDLLDCIIPKLVVQPIVENAVLHGLEGKEDGHIRVRVVEQEQNIRIEVIDDGCGISQEVMEELNSRKQEKMAGHIGFYNVDTIIQLNYGKEYGLRVSRPEEGGTCVIIVLPMRREKTTDVKGIGG